MRPTLPVLVVSTVLSALAIGVVAAMAVGAAVAPSEIARANRELGVYQAWLSDAEVRAAQLEVRTAADESWMPLPQVLASGYPTRAGTSRGVRCMRSTGEEVPWSECAATLARHDSHIACLGAPLGVECYSADSTTGRVR